MFNPKDVTPDTALTADLVGPVVKNRVADVARLVALDIGCFRQRCGDVAQDDLSGTRRAAALEKEARLLLLHAMRSLLPELVAAMGVAEGSGEDARR